MLAAQPLHELQSKSHKSVFVGNRNCADSACTDAFQKGRKAFAVVVEAAADVADELGVGVVLAEPLTLPFKIGGLLGRADASVENDMSTWCCCCCLFVSKLLGNVSGVVESTPIGCASAHDADLFLDVGPTSKGWFGNIVLFEDVLGRHVLVRLHIQLPFRKVQVEIKK